LERLQIDELKNSRSSGGFRTSMCMVQSQCFVFAPDLQITP
jgi:hypothetical protein